MSNYLVPPRVDEPLSDDDEHEYRMKAARARAQWELGDPQWAHVIIGAYLAPDDDFAALTYERNEP